MWRALKDAFLFKGVALRHKLGRLTDDLSLDNPLRESNKGNYICRRYKSLSYSLSKR